MVGVKMAEQKVFIFLNSIVQINSYSVGQVDLFFCSKTDWKTKMRKTK